MKINLSLSLTVRPVVVYVPNPWDGKEDEEQNEAPIIQGEIVSDLV